MGLFGKDKIRPGGGSGEPVAANDLEDWERLVETVKQRIDLEPDARANRRQACARVGGHLWNAPARYNRECEACGAGQYHDTDGGY